jgi:transcription termination factor Rho
MMAGEPQVSRHEPRQQQSHPQKSFQDHNDPQVGNSQGGNNQNGQPRESRSKRRREKRKRRGEQRQPQGQGHRPDTQRHQGNQGNQGNQGANVSPRAEAHSEPRPIQLNGPKIETNGMLELAPKGFGFLRVPQKGFEQARDDVFVTPETIRKFNLRLGQWIHGVYQEGPRGPQLVEITTINGMAPEEAAKLPHFEELKAINPTRRISFETTPERFTTRVVDIMSPVGRGQRGLIVSPPRSGKTTLLLHMAEAIREKYDEAIHLMVLLVDERPEEVTEFRRALPGAEIYASSNDEQPRNHCRIAELAIERAKRLVEAGQDVFLLMDSITRLARAYNNTMNNRGRGTGSGGITIGALEVPRRLFAAARNTRGGGSLTIMATALIQTNSRADEAIFMEFKGTGNMELVLDRKIAENYIYPAVDIFKSGTRREELLIPDHMLHKIHLIRRGLSGHRPVEAMERLLFFLKKFPNNPQMLLEIKG